MRILLLTQWFDPEPFFKGLPFAKALKDLGHEVQVLTGFPNYPGGKLYHGYKIKLFQREVIDGIRVNRVALFPSHDRSSFKRICNYASFAISASVLGLFLIGKVDIIYAYQPGTISLPAFILKMVKRAPLVYDIQDLWPDTISVSGMMRSRIVLWILGKWMDLVYKSADKIVVQSPGFGKELILRGVDEEKIEAVYNWCDENSLLSSVDNNIDSEDEAMLGDKFNVIFAGNMGKVQGLEAVIEAAEILHDDWPKIQFIFVGDGTEANALKDLANKKALSNVIFMGRKPIHKVGSILGRADALLVHLKDDPLFRITIPSKTQAYMAMGKPILIGVKGDAEHLVLEAGAGISSMPEDPVSIAESVLALNAMSEQERINMGLRGKEFYDNKLSMPVGIMRFERIFLNLLGCDKGDI